MALNVAKAVGCPGRGLLGGITLPSGLDAEKGSGFIWFGSVAKGSGQ